MVGRAQPTFSVRAGTEARATDIFQFFERDSGS